MLLGLLYPGWLYLCNQRGAFWVQICPAVRTQWTTPLIFQWIITSLAKLHMCSQLL